MAAHLKLYLTARAVISMSGPVAGVDLPWETTKTGAWSPQQEETDVELGRPDQILMELFSGVGLHSRLEICVST